MSDNHVAHDFAERIRDRLPRPFQELCESVFADEPPSGFKSMLNAKDLTDWSGKRGR